MPFSSAFPWPSPPPHPLRQVSVPPTPLFSGQRRFIYDLLILIGSCPKGGLKQKKTWTWLYSNLPHWAPEQKSSRQLEQLYKVTNMVSTYIDQLFKTRDSFLIAHLDHSFQHPAFAFVGAPPPGRVGPFCKSRIPGPPTRIWLHLISQWYLS